MSHIQEKGRYSSSWMLLLASLTALGPLSIDMYLPALPQMADDFGVSTQSVANSLPAYFLGLAIGQLIYGPLSDRIGRKKPLYVGLSLYVVASLLCIFADSAWELIAARVLQALGGCVGVVVARAAIRDRLDLQTSSQAFASMMIVSTIAPIIAPSLGAWVLNDGRWEYIFLGLMLIGLANLCAVHFLFQETLAEKHRLKLNFYQILSLYTAILQDTSFRRPMLVGCFAGAVLFCYISASAAILMEHYGLSQQIFAYTFGANALGIMLFSTLNKRLAKTQSVFQRLKWGSLLQCTGVILLLYAGSSAQAPLYMVCAGMFLAVSAIGFTGPNSMAIAMSEQGARAGTASAIMGSAQFGCGLLGGILLNFLTGSALFNMAIVMALFSALAIYSFFRLQWTHYTRS